MKELLDPCPMFAGLAAAAVCKVHVVDSVDVDDGEYSGAGLGVRALFRRMMTKLEDQARLPERQLLEIGASPFLHPTSVLCETTCMIQRLTSIVWMG